MEAIKTLNTLMQEIEKAFGVDVCLAEAAAVYDSEYRSEPYPLSKYLELNDYLTLEEVQEELGYSLIARTYAQLYPYAKELVESLLDGSLGDDSAEALYSDISEWKHENKEKVQQVLSVISPSTLVVDICNYKGEGEGLALFEQSKQLQVFVSKYNYR